MKSKNEHIIVRGALVCCISSFRRTEGPLVGHKAELIIVWFELWYRISFEDL